MGCATGRAVDSEEPVKDENIAMDENSPNHKIYMHALA